MKSRILLALAAFAPMSAASAQQPRATIVVGVRQLGPVGYRDPIGAISPDGRWLAWAADAHLYVRPMQVGSAFELGAPENVKLQLAWLPDGDRMAVREGVPGLGPQWAVYDVAKRTRSVLWDGASTIVGHPAESSTGDSIRIPISQLQELAWSPDGRSVAGLAYAGPRSQFWMIDADGRSARVTTTDRAINSLAWLPDSRRVACIIRTDAGPRVSLPCGDSLSPGWREDAYGPLAFSPDGSALYFASPNVGGTLDLWSRSLRDGSARKLTNLPRDTYAPSVAHDGRVLFKSQTYWTTIEVIPSTGGSSRTVTDFMAETPEWDWTSTQIGVTYGNWRRVVDDQHYPDISQDVGIVDVGNSAPAKAVKTVVQASPSEDQGMCWSPNGRWIAFHSHQRHTDDIWLEPADGSAPPRQISMGGYETGWPRWSRDGRWIAFMTEQPDARGTHGRLFVIPVDQETGKTQPAQPVPLDGVAGSAEHAEWMPDGEHLVVSTAGPTRSERAIYVVSRDGGREPPRRIHQFTSEQRYSGVAVSPDGSLVAFVAPATDGVFQLFTVPISGGAERQITRDPVDKTQPAWSPDGKWIAFTRWEYRVDFLIQAPDRPR
jgi:Tol biopolymer transport system component